MDEIFGLPAHPLIVHAVVVLVPLSALGSIASVLSARVRSHVGWLVAAMALLDLVLVPLATGSGEALEERVGESARIDKHAEMGEQLLPWVIALAVGISAVMLLARAAARRTPGAPTPAWAARWVATAAVVLTLVAASGTLVQVARIGHSGADATWSDVGASAAPRGPASSAR